MTTTPTPSTSTGARAATGRRTSRRELVRVVDSRFRTIANRRGRAIVGVSAGGYGAAAIGFNHLDKYSSIESWSGYFVPTDPTGQAKLDRGSQAANDRASLHTLVKTSVPEIKEAHPFFAFYVGRGDSRFLAENVRARPRAERRARRARLRRLRRWPHDHALGAARRHVAPPRRVAPRARDAVTAA